MVKIIVLQQWRHSSDVGMEEALQDRLSFRRFAELRLADAAPDHSTTSRFRKKIMERGLARALFAEVNRQLESKGMLVKRGTNGLLSKVRAPVEQALGTLKRCYRYWRVRYMGLMRNEAEALFKTLGCNLRRADGLREGCLAHG